MILDERTEFADATSVGTPNNTTVNVGDIIDLGGTTNDPGAGEPIYLVIQVTTAIGSGGAATVRFLLSSDATTTIAVDATQTTHWASDVFALATLVAGFQLVVPLPAKSPAYERYLAVQVQETAGQALNAGAINAFLTHDPWAYTTYPDATN